MYSLFLISYDTGNPGYMTVRCHVNPLVGFYDNYVEGVYSLAEHITAQFIVKLFKYIFLQTGCGSRHKHGHGDRDCGGYCRCKFSEAKFSHHHCFRPHHQYHHEDHRQFYLHWHRSVTIGTDSEMTIV